jgi:hypothetical protein
MADNYSAFTAGLESPAEHAVAVSPHDTNDLATTPRALYIGTQGDVKVDMAGSGAVTFVAVSGLLPVRVTKVYDTGTDADDIVGIW